MKIPRLVAHRGDMANRPENSLAALSSALQAGACLVEFDVQLCADDEPVLLHDSNLQRTAGLDGSVFELDARELAELSVHEPARFGERFRPTPVPRLDQALALIARCPRATALVEIKQESLRHWGTDRVLDAIDRALAPHRDQCIPISYSRAALEGMRDRGARRVGWVLARYDREAREQARRMAPELLICNQRKLPDGARPWAGDWQWMLYDIMDPARALDWAARGVDLIETGDPARLLADPVLARAACRHERS